MSEATAAAPSPDDDAEIDVEGAQHTAQGVAVIGRVAAAGARASGLIGRRVLAGPLDPCGECEICRRGGAPVCPRVRRRERIVDGRVIAAARWLVPLGDGLELPSPAGAAAAGDAAVAYTLYARTGPSPREPIVIAGASPVARFLVEILRAKGAAPVVVADPARGAWAAWVEARGGVVARASDEGGVDAARAAVAEALAPQGAAGRPWRVIAAAPAAIALAAALAGPRATLTVLAPAPDLPGALAAREVTVIGVAGAHPDLIVEVAAMCAKGEIDLAGGTAAAPDELLRAVVA